MRFSDSVFTLVVLLLVVAIGIGITLINRIELFFVALLSSIMMGSVSPLIAARRLYFLAVEASHLALLAATLSIVLANITPIRYEFFWVVVLGLAMMYVIGIAIHRGVDPDIVTSVATSVVVSSSVMAMYIVLTRFRVSYSLWSLILGDPLLTTRNELYVLTILAIIVTSISLAIYRFAIYIGIDRDSVLLTFRNAEVYEFLFFTVIGLTSLAVVKIVGYVLEHILLLLPALVAMNMVEGGKKVMFTSICLSIASSLLGFSLALRLNIAPASAVGFTALAMYIISIAINRLKRHG